jgi:hypothetical protein
VLFLFSWGVSVTDRANNSPGETADTLFTKAQFFPAGGSLAALPSTVTITFSQIPQRFTFALSPSLLDESGNRLSGARTVVSQVQ